MFDFTKFIRANDGIRDVIQRYPQTREVFEEAGIRACCYDCSIRAAALRGGIELSGLLAELDRAAFGEDARSPACPGSPIRRSYQPTHSSACDS